MFLVEDACKPSRAFAIGGEHPVLYIYNCVELFPDLVILLVLSIMHSCIMMLELLPTIFIKRPSNKSLAVCFSC